MTSLLHRFWPGQHTSTFTANRNQLDWFGFRWFLFSYFLTDRLAITAGDVFDGDGRSSPFDSEVDSNAISPSRLSDVIDTVTRTEREQETKSLFFIFIFSFDIWPLQILSLSLLSLSMLFLIRLLFFCVLNALCRTDWRWSFLPAPPPSSFFLLLQLSSDWGFLLDRLKKNPNLCSLSYRFLSVVVFDKFLFNHISLLCLLFFTMQV